VRAERLYSSPKNCPISALYGYCIQVSGWVRLRRSGSNRRTRWRCFLQPGQAQMWLDLPSEKRACRRRSSLQAYLSGETIPGDGPSGWRLVSVDGWPLGWGKRRPGHPQEPFPARLAGAFLIRICSSDFSRSATVIKKRATTHSCGLCREVATTNSPSVFTGREGQVR